MGSNAKPIQKSTRTPPPATTPEARDRQMTALAYDLVEKRIRAGTATSQEICHFLKVGSQRERNENAIATEQIKLVRAKTEAMQSAKNVEALYKDAIKAIGIYNGGGSDIDDET